MLLPPQVTLSRREEARYVRFLIQSGKRRKIGLGTERKSEEWAIRDSNP